jgi:hypothetical protein
MPEDLMKAMKRHGVGALTIQIGPCADMEESLVVAAQFEAAKRKKPVWFAIARASDLAAGFEWAMERAHREGKL